MANGSNANWATNMCSVGGGTSSNIAGTTVSFASYPTYGTYMSTTGSGMYTNISTSGVYGFSNYTTTNNKKDITKQDIPDIIKINEWEIENLHHMILFALARGSRYDRGEYFISNNTNLAFVYSVLILNDKFDDFNHNKIVAKSAFHDPSNTKTINPYIEFAKDPTLIEAKLFTSETPPHI